MGSIRSFATRILSVPPILFVVDRKEAGQTLSAILKKRFGLSWAQAKRLVERQHVKVSGQVETDVARRLKVGKQIELASGTVELPPEQRKGLEERRGSEVQKKGDGVKGRKGDRTQPGTTPARTPSVQSAKKSADVGPSLSRESIVYSDDAVVVVNKPAGLTTMRHKEEAEEFGARAKRFLPRTLAELLPALLGAPDRAVIAVHRIDRDTSGLVVFALTHSAAENLMKQFRKHTVDRRYLALTR
ncbi:MAG: pseudouridine synthase, partial [Planctomycetia bacterium]|nr:pseudouridine synthase [Planctomycetia bacterium]